MYKRNNNDVDLESVAAFLKDAVTKVKTQENPDLLNDIKKVYKKNVPWNLRLYVAAYLTKEIQKNFKGSYRPRKDFRETKKYDSSKKTRETKFYDTNSSNFSATEERISRTRVQIDPSVASTIFISIGRNRRVFPRDLVGLLISVAGLERDRIGNIRVLANYSFVQLFQEDAQKAIDALNEYDFRGMKLSVSYSKQKDAEDETQDLSKNYEQTQVDEDAAALAAAEKAATNEPFSAGGLSSEN